MTQGTITQLIDSLRAEKRELEEELFDRDSKIKDLQKEIKDLNNEIESRIKIWSAEARGRILSGQILEQALQQALRDRTNRLWSVRMQNGDYCLKISDGPMTEEDVLSVFLLFDFPADYKIPSQAVEDMMDRGIVLVDHEARRLFFRLDVR
jgi:hypothetical protein